MISRAFVMPADDNVERGAPSIDEGREFGVAAGHEGDRVSCSTDRS